MGRATDRWPTNMWRAFRRWPRTAQVLVGLLLCWTLIVTVTTRDLDSGRTTPAAQTTSTAPPTTGEHIESTTTTIESADLGDPTAIDALLARVEVRPEGSSRAYDRNLFGGWTDDDGDGCDTRAEVLQAESAIPVQLGPSGCHVVAGQWLSIYDGYSTPDPSELEIDHVVALAEAWRSGASEWSPERRMAFANDLGHPDALVAVTAAMNRSKSDRDPASWQPPNRAAWCMYASDWVTVKAWWHLSVDEAEATALRNMLAGCGLAATTTTSLPPVTAPVTTVAAVAPSGQCDASYPTVCIPSAPPDLDCGDVTYRRFTVLAPDPHGFDGDHDGEGCES